MNYGGFGIPQGLSAKLNIQNTDIKNAKVGLANHEANGGPYWIPNASGGIIRATNVTIRNCAYSVRMVNQAAIVSGKKLNDLSYFVKCNFICDAQPPTYGAESALVFLNNIEGLTFRACAYTNDASNHYIDYGIKAIDAGFIVEDWCTTTPASVGKYKSPCAFSIDHSSFSNFRHDGTTNIKNEAVYVINNLLYLHNVVVNGATFSYNNHVPIYISGCPYASVCGNNILWPNGDYEADQGFIGIEVSSCPGIKLQENFVASTTGYSGWTPGGSNKPAVGIVTNNIGTSPNLVYKNVVCTLDYAIQAIGENRTSAFATPQTGLQLLCNNILSDINESYDIISAGAGYPNAQNVTLTSGIASGQFNSTAGTTQSAANLFSYKISGGNNHLDNALAAYPNHSIEYYYSTASSLEEPIYTNIGGGHKISTSSYGCESKILPWQPMALTVFTGKLPVITGLESSEENHLVMARRQELFDSVMTTFLWNDSLKIQLDSVELALSSMDYHYDYKILLAAVYCTQGRYQDALDLIDAIDDDEFTSEETSRISHIRQLVELEKDLVENNYDWGEVNGTLIEQMEGIANNDDYFGRDIARYYMGRYEDTYYAPDFVWEEEEEARSSSNSALLYNPHLNSIYPNPTSGNLNVVVKKQSGNTHATIIDVHGRTILKNELHEGINKLNLGPLNKGIYFLTLVSSKGEIETIKIVRN